MSLNIDSASGRIEERCPENVVMNPENPKAKEAFLIDGKEATLSSSNVD
jgi:hypothetical protein